MTKWRKSRARNTDDGEQLKKVTEIVQKYSIKPPVDSHSFSIDQANEAMKLVAGGKLNGKVVIRF